MDGHTGARPERRDKRDGADRRGGSGNRDPRKKRDHRDGRDSREKRGGEIPKVEAPPIPDEVEFKQLDKGARASLRTLSKDNAEDVGRHLIMVGLLLEEDPELAYRHALAAVARAGRVDVVREAAALAAYSTGRYGHALRELRTARRLSGSTDHFAIEADCERGLGRPERAIALAKTPEAAALSGVPLAEMQIVVAGARLDLGDAAAALHILERITTGSEETVARVAEAKIDVLRALGRDADADAIEATLPPWDDEDEIDIIVYDAEDDAEAEGGVPPESADPDPEDPKVSSS